MAQAKPRKRRGASTPQTQSSASPGKWFMGGLCCGVFLSFVLWLATVQPDARPAADGSVAAGTDQEVAGDAEENKLKFDFYTLLPEQQVRVEPRPATTQAKTSAARPASPLPPADSALYLLQAGSFKKNADADRRRAELLLLGLDARVEEAKGDNGRWFRVYVGPFQDRSKLAQARSLTAQQGIDTLLLKRPRQG
jgi:cell division protein FtsN